MHTLTVVVGNVSWGLLFKTEEAAAAAAKELFQSRSLEHQWAPLSDDFGQKVWIKLESLHAYLLEDMDETKVAHVQRALFQAKVQLAAQQAAEHDPGLRRPIQSPIMSPFNGGPR